MQTKVHLVKAMVFPVVMYGCESWTIKKDEQQWIDVFELWCWRRLLRVPWTARRSNQSILKEINPEYLLEGLMLANTLATWCEELIHLKRLWCWERLRAGGKGDNRGWDGWMASPTRWTWVWVNSGSWWWTGRPGVLWSMGSQRVWHDWVTELNCDRGTTVLQDTSPHSLGGNIASPVSDRVLSWWPAGVAWETGAGRLWSRPLCLVLWRVPTLFSVFILFPSPAGHSRSTAASASTQQISPMLGLGASHPQCRSMSAAHHLL